ncbi:glycoside hydrolase family 3 protein [Neurospora crassa]|uniref:xylan 1,4-beta-xylosidase n=2 Tax=Neurospora crassa TaxID=5141 RepID=F5HDC6_NEUCR|nr:beta-xylosidase [Neurospora crassa OR74A]EAA28973.2 beta-xylosidase [Neurospora crassa OR74A]KHE84908.1 glycoside hydrolase family 3 protein [Neurospora crassa]CAB91343.2 related to xylan 1, 4-beta-xylosidase [Neurospora crassa]|eukprot:XP_958209.2 beta-xylosidase [Neurospora crassa OR74A]
MKSSWASYCLLSCTSALVSAIDLPFQTYPDCVNGPLASLKVCDATLSPPQRAAALVAAMTTEEKLQNLVSKSKGAPRIGLPAYNWWSEALHGVAYAPGTQFRSGDGPFNSSTSFPMPLLMAATFDDELIEKVGEVIGTEGRAFGNAGFSGFDYWTPNVNPFKDPRWGRGSETPGEDILRIKRYAASMIRGLQGPLPERRVVATCKHYAANDFEDWNGSTRHDFDAKVTLQDLAEYYLSPFQQCARDSKVGSIMCSYNAVNGVPACANTYLMQTILREHWNWTAPGNYITSDCEAVLDIFANHHYAKTNAEGTALAFEAGTDSSCEYESSSDIPGAWTQGLLEQSTVDRALTRLYEGLVRVGYFDGNHSEYASLGWKDVNSPKSQEVALQTAVEGIVLLKNDQTLPLGLKTDPKSKLAMIGFWANDPKTLSGGYSGKPAFEHSPVYAAEAMGFNVTTAGGPVLQNSTSNDTWTQAALEAAQDANYILYFGGLDTSAAGETKDRTTINWPEAQLQLIKTLTKLGKPLVVVQMGDQLDNTPLLATKTVNSILWANWPGQDGGTAVMQILTGLKSPAGRLPVTQYPANYTAAVPMTDMNLRPSDRLPGRTYRWYPTAVQPFGFGLHYTTFQAKIAAPLPRLAIQDLLSRCGGDNANAYPDTCALPPLKVEVTNSGNRSSDYVVLAFLAGDAGPRPYPIKTLVSYTRLRDVSPGHKTTAHLEWTLGDIARYDEQGNTVLYPGTYTVTVDEPAQASASFVVEGEAVVLDRWPAPSGQVVV